MGIAEWIVDAALKDHFGSVVHEKLMAVLGKRIADSDVLKLIQQMLKASYEVSRFSAHETKLAA